MSFSLLDKHEPIKWARKIDKKPINQIKARAQKRKKHCVLQGPFVLCFAASNSPHLWPITMHSVGRQCHYFSQPLWILWDSLIQL